jgi:hypothetical protein
MPNTIFHHNAATTPCLRLASIVAATGAAMIGFAAAGQSIRDRLDEDRFLREVTELRLPEVLERYVESNPAADSATSAIYRLASARMRLADPALKPEAVEAAFERVSEARRALIDGHPHDTRLATWLADQAADLLFVVYPIEATALSAEYGLPTDSQRQRASRVAAEMIDLMDEAEIAIQEAIMNLESQPGYENDIALQLQRRRLARDERDRRIPFLLGVAACLHAEFNLADPSQRMERLRLAADLLSTLADELEGAVRTRARLYAARALARLGRSDECAALLDDVLNGPDASRTDLFAARMIDAIREQEVNGHEAALAMLASMQRDYENADGMFFRLLVADRRFLILRGVAERVGAAEREQAYVDAFAAYTDLLDADFGVPRGTLQSIVFERLTNAAGPETPADRLPPIVKVARAERLTRDPETLQQGIDLFNEAIEHGGLDERTRAIGRFGLARALHAADRRKEAADLFLALAADHPTDPQAERAVEIAATILADLHRADPRDATVESSLGEAISLLLAKYPTSNAIDQWRLFAGEHRLRRGRFDEARDALNAIPMGSPEWLASRVALAEVTREEVRVEHDGAKRAALNERLRAEAVEARNLIVPTRDREADRDRARALNDELARLDVLEAEALLDLGRAAEAIERLAGFGPHAEVPRSLLAEALSLRVKALHRAGRVSEAAGEVRRFLGEIPDRIGEIAPDMLDALKADVEAIVDRGDQDAARRKAVDELVPLAQELEAWMRGRAIGDHSAALLRIRIGDAYRLGAMWTEALGQYDSALLLLPDTLEATLGRAECLLALDRLAESIEAFKRIAASTRAERGESFWLAELRLLQILDRADRNTRQIAPRIAQLRQLDPTLGGERLRVAFEALLLKHQ